jgi:predicted ribosome-associated RNA-binding protein Tma20
LKEGVQKYIFNGADLMWPGILKIEHDKGFKKFSQGDVAVIYALNGLKINDEDEDEEN